ncbi:hypothetical protein CIB84_001936 [Bambusicola thoracicus]|uniref:Ig-like domain-containing protein n=1 Tax=Bambusicola thoracicus TaxID=9083 RepID=A0A2P4TD65_BAMTH|nr:hypothetical protein CIB84_001936 [Bambusicola thoracicus]
MWQFSSLFSRVDRWQLSDVVSMSEHLKECPFYKVERKTDPVLLTGMVDVVLGCSYVGEGGLPRAFGGSEHPATLVLRGLSVTDDGTLGDVTDYEIPQEDQSSSPPIIFEASVEFQSSSNNTSLRTRLGSSITLDCRFALAPSFLLSSLEWRRQHRGSGRSLFRYHVGNAGLTAQPKVHVDVEQLLENGDASLTLQEATVNDEGTYICLVSTAQHQVQHNIQLLVSGK